MLETQPRAIIIAGPNGAGKTTFAREFLPVEAQCPVFVNADLIAAGLSPFAPEAAAIKAGRIMLAEIDDHVAHCRSFALETTLSGRAYAAKVQHWRALGYQVSLYFLQLPTAEMAIERVRLRVAQGGHHIPDDVVRRRFAAGLQQFENTYKPIVNAWFLYGQPTPPSHTAGQRNPAMNTVLNTSPIALDPAQAALNALARAGLRAAEEAQRANTHMVLAENRQVVHVSPQAYLHLTLRT
ncbi:MAG: zeta toxin family protein [Hydrogenophaga sp.]|nr:zeta toxin family protein [Hydrogenophaga sp.]